MDTNLKQVGKVGLVGIQPQIQPLEKGLDLEVGLRSNPPPSPTFPTQPRPTFYLPTPEPAGRWFVAITNPNCHRRAELELYSLGFRTFVPKLRKWVSHARVRKAVERPLLGRYMFVEIADRFDLVKSANGVEGLVSISGVPQPIPSHYVEDFRMRYMAGEWDFVAREQIPIGARVRIMEGQFENFLATLVRRRKGHKVEVKLMGTPYTRTVFEVSVRPAA